MKRKVRTLTEVIKAKVDPIVKTTFRSYAEKNLGITESQLLRKIIIDYLNERGVI